MAGETINQLSSSWVVLQASNSTVDGAMSAGAVTAIGSTSLTANEQKYPLLDFRVSASAVGTVNQTFDIYRRPSDGSNPAPAPSDTYLQQYVGSAVVNAATGSYYLYGVSNVDPADSYYVMNNTGITQTCVLNGRTRGWNTAA